MRKIGLARNALRADHAGQLRLHWQGQLVDALNHQGAVVTVHDGTLSSHARITEKHTVLVLAAETGQRDDGIGLALPAAAVVNGLSKHFQLRPCTGFDQHRTGGAGIAACFFEFRTQIDEQMLQHVEAGDCRITVQK